MLKVNRLMHQCQFEKEQLLLKLVFDKENNQCSTLKIRIFVLKTINNKIIYNKYLVSIITIISIFTLCTSCGKTKTSFPPNNVTDQIEDGKDRKTKLSFQPNDEGIANALMYANNVEIENSKIDGGVSITSFKKGFLETSYGCLH